MMLVMYHPWRAMRDLPGWTVEFRPIPGPTWGLTDATRGVITIDSGLTQAQRRCTLEHERQHVIAGHDGPQDARTERAIELAAARMLIDLDDLARELRWAPDEHQLADAIWVDLRTLRTRLAALTAAERAYLGITA